MTYNMLCSPLLSNEQVSLCSTYLTAIPEDIEMMQKDDFVNLICEKFAVTSEDLALAMRDFRLFYCDITCIHCGVRYEITQPLSFHDLPTSPRNWTCEGCRNFLKQSFDFSLLMDWFPTNNSDNSTL